MQEAVLVWHFESIDNQFGGLSCDTSPLKLRQDKPTDLPHNFILPILFPKSRGFQQEFDLFQPR